MRYVKSVSAIALAAAVAIGVAADAAAQDEQFVVVGTGGVTGVYYPTGGAIQRLVNANRAEHGIRVSVESTGGSIFNLNALASGEMDMGVVQSDWQFHSFNGSHENFPEANPDLRAVFSIHGEPFTVVARADSGIETFEDLVGKRVNIGNPGSGARGTMEVLMEAYGWTVDDFAQASELATAEQSQALCDNNVDVIVFTVGHPSGTIQEATTSCESHIIPVQSEVVDKLIEDNPFYAYSTVPGGMYPNNPDDVTTFGVKATFVTTTALSTEAVETIVSAVFENFDQFIALHPAYQGLTPEQMANDGMSAPVHDGAMSYYCAAGLRDDC